MYMYLLTSSLRIFSHKKALMLALLYVVVLNTMMVL